MFCPRVFADDAASELVIRDDKKNILFRHEARPGEPFAIRYKHSVALTPVTDYFILKDGGIWLDRTVYRDFGAGLPTSPEAGQKMRVGNGEIEISGFNRELPEFSVRVGRIADHTLLLWPEGLNGGRELEIPLNSLAPPGAALSFSVTRK